MEMSVDFVDILVRMPGALWRHYTEDALAHGRDPIQDIVNCLSASADKDVVIRISTELVDKQ